MNINSRRQFIRYEGPLKALDPALEEYAARNPGLIEKNHWGWPSRKLYWTGEDGIQRILEVGLTGDGSGYLVAGGGYFRKSDREFGSSGKIVFEEMILPLEIEKIGQNLSAYAARLNQIKMGDLKFEAVEPAPTKFSFSMFSRKRWAFVIFINLAMYLGEIALIGFILWLGYWLGTKYLQ
jgi:hypothetical protein